MKEDTVAGIFFSRVSKYGSREALKVKRKGAWLDISWDDWGRNTKELAMGLMVLGLGQRENVALMSENRPEWTYADLGILAANAVDVPIYATNIPDQVEHILKDSGSRFVIVSTEAQLEKVRSVRENLPDLEKAIIMDPAQDHGEDWVMTFSEIQRLGKEKGDEKAIEQRMESIKPDDLATLIYTSGTTGAPKGVMLTHANFVSNMAGCLEALPISDKDTCLSFLPLSHSFERMGGYYALMQAGGTIAYAESIEKVTENILEIRPTFMCSVPRLYEKMHGRILAMIEQGTPFKKKMFSWSFDVGTRVKEHTSGSKQVPIGLRIKHQIADRLVFSKLRDRLGGRLRFFVSGGAPLSREIAEFFDVAGIIILEGYGLTETTPVISINRLDSYIPGSVGKPLEGLEVRTDDLGEILVRGPSIMKGYYNREDATREVLSPEGWFATGDIGYLDQDNSLYITDRKKDIIVTSGGKNISPQNIENMLKLNRFIEQVCVIGDKRKYLTALIAPSFPVLEEFAKSKGITTDDREKLVKEPAIQELFQEAIDAANGRLARYETLKKFEILPVEFTQESGELTPTAKIKRKFVVEKYGDRIEAMYT